MTSMERNLIMFNIKDIVFKDLISKYEERNIDFEVYRREASLHMNKPGYEIEILEDAKLLVRMNYAQVTLPNKDNPLSSYILHNDHSDEERHLLFSHLKRIYESTNKLIMNLTKMIFISEFYTNVPYIEATERIEEFELIKDHKIDMISLESLYNFYNQPFNYELPSN